MDREKKGLLFATGNSDDRLIVLSRRSVHRDASERRAKTALFPGASKLERNSRACAGETEIKK